MDEIGSPYNQPRKRRRIAATLAVAAFAIASIGATAPGYAAKTPKAAIAAPNADDDESLKIFRKLDDDVSAIKKRALEINRDLLVVEEESFIPPSSQIVVFLSLRKKTLVKTGDVQVKLEIDNAVVANHNYTIDEINAMVQGGMHRLYLGNLPVGPHSITVSVDGLAKDSSSQRRGYDVTKAWSRKFVNITLEIGEKDDKTKFGFEEL